MTRPPFVLLFVILPGLALLTACGSGGGGNGVLPSGNPTPPPQAGPSPQPQSIDEVPAADWQLADITDNRIQTGTIAVADWEGTGQRQALIAYLGAIHELARSPTGWELQEVLPNVDADRLLAKDMDLDGDVDLVTLEFDRRLGAQRFYKLAWYENPDGPLSWSRHSIGTQSFKNVQDLSVTDIDADGDIDILLNQVSGLPYLADEDITLLLNDGSGDYQSAVAGTIVDPGFTGFEDIDDDGDLDIIVLKFGSHNTLTTGEVLLNDDGLGGSWSQQRLLTDIICKAGTMADMNGDGQADLIWSEDTSAINGHGHRLWWAANQGLSIWQARQVTVPGADIRTFQVADLDQDGDQDVLALLHLGSQPSQQLAVIARNDGLGNFTQEKTSIMQNQFSNQSEELHMLDLDGDGSNDLLTTRDSLPIGVLAWFLGGPRPVAVSQLATP